ncbi:G protein-coupled receptor 157 [Mytilus galloprovincialis]|uniref:G protein-coupled receptor 157 n=1 Tax=Mytilus galloprovincialis TaxID=29158 RepID=A0A8B6F0I8_MYTGA|nr:G protein-coupled receptor 157 [Mytilus galloprovincialis]
MSNDTIKFNPGELAVSAVITTISSLLSILGGLVLIWSYYVVPSTRNTVRLMLIALTLADILTASGYLMATMRWYSIGLQNTNTCDSASDNFCKAQSFITTFSNIASFLWTSFIAIYLFICVWFSRVVDISGVMFTCVLVVAWGIPGIITTVALTMGVLGKNESVTGINGVWCWLAVTSIDHNGILWMLLAGKDWKILTYLITAILYILLKGKGFLNKIRRQQFIWSQISTGLRREDELFCLTWLVQYCLRIWGTARFILDIAKFNNYKVETVFFFLQSYGDSAQAFWNFILFCVCDQSVRSYISDRYFTCGNTSKLNNTHCSIEKPDIQHINDEERPLL